MLTVRHDTHYRYTEPIRYSIQTLRLTPRAEAHQHVRSWKISTPGRRHAFVDAYGNLSHMLTFPESHDELRISVEGMVDVLPIRDGRIAERSTLSPLVFTVPTRLTRADEAIVDFARRSLPKTPRSADLMALAEAICGAVRYESGHTVVTSPAADALRMGRGVCQDHAHLFLACCHAAGVPARYVSGYIGTGSTEDAESHAWVDAWAEDAGFAGWVSIDVTHAKFQDQGFCRLAVGRDYDSAGPVRGIRRGGGGETLTVHVKVIQDAMTQ